MSVDSSRSRTYAHRPFRAILSQYIYARSLPSERVTASALRPYYFPGRSCSTKILRRGPYLLRISNGSIVFRHGTTEVLITDRAVSFLAQLTQKMICLSHTDHRRTMAYHPRTNGWKTTRGMRCRPTLRLLTTVQFKIPLGLHIFSCWTTIFEAMLAHDRTDDGTVNAQLVAQWAEKARR